MSNFLGRMKINKGFYKKKKTRNANLNDPESLVSGCRRLRAGPMLGVRRGSNLFAHRSQRFMVVPGPFRGKGPFVGCLGRCRGRRRVNTRVYLTCGMSILRDTR